MEKLTDLLKKATVLKNGEGLIIAIDYVKSLIFDNNLKEEDFIRCCKKIISFIKKDNPISIPEWNDYFLKLADERITTIESKSSFYYDLYFFLKDYKEYELCMQMIRKIMLNLDPNDFNYIMGLSKCFRSIAELSLHTLKNEKEKYLTFLTHETYSFILEAAGQINIMLFFGFDTYFGYREYDTNAENSVYFGENFNTSLSYFNLSEKKDEILSEVKQFIGVDIAKTMEFPEAVINGDKTITETEGIKYFKNPPMVIEFSNKLFSKYIQ